MKKLLALVLALVMSMSLVTISNAAFSDAADIDYKEAVDVLAAVGVLEGSDGKFDPKAELTREQAAKIIAYLDLGKDVAEALPAVKVFNDVEASRWSAKFVAYCADAGYINGVGNGNFDPTGKLTGYAFGKLLLCALGYDATLEEMTGASWTIKVAKLMESNDLTKGTSKLGSAVLTREEAAQYALNALKATTVAYDEKGSTITAGDVTIVTGAQKAKDVTVKAKEGNNAYAAAISGEVLSNDAQDLTVELGEKLYKGDLKLSTVANGDDFGRNAKAWTYKNGDDIATHAESADLTFVAGKTYSDTFGTNNTDKAANAAKIIAQINDQLDYTKASSKLAFTGSKYEDDGTLKEIGNGVEMYTNGVQKTLFEGLQIGDVVELYLNDSDNKKVDEVVVIRYSIGEITKVDTTVSKAQKEDGATCRVSVEGHPYTDNNIEGFDAKTFVEDAYILYVAKGTKLIATAIPATVEGKVTATKGGKAQIAGTYYEDTTDAAVGDEGIFYLGKANQIVKADTTASKSADYAYVYNWTYEKKANSDGEKKDTFTVYYVTADGVKASAVAKHVKGTDADANKYWLDLGGAHGVLLGTVTDGELTKANDGAAFVVAFSINSDGKFVQKTARDGITKAATKQINKTHPVVGTGNHSASVAATNDTKFIFVGSDWKVKTATGYKNADANARVIAVYNSDNEALYAFVGAKNAYKTSTKLAVLLDAEPSVTMNDDKDETYATFTVAIDGAETKLTFKSDPAVNGEDAYLLAGSMDGTVFAYKMNGDYAELDSDEFTASVKGIAELAGDIVPVTVKGTGYIGVDGAEYLDTTDAKIYTITLEAKDNAAELEDVDSVTVGEGAKIDLGDYVVYTLDGTDVETLFVYDLVGYPAELLAP